MAGKTALVEDPAASSAAVGSEGGATAFEVAKERAGQAWEKVRGSGVVVVGGGGGM